MYYVYSKQPTYDEMWMSRLLYANLHIQTCGTSTALISEFAKSSEFSPHIIFAVTCLI